MRSQGTEKERDYQASFSRETYCYYCNFITFLRRERILHVGLGISVSGLSAWIVGGHHNSGSSNIACTNIFFIHSLKFENGLCRNTNSNISYIRKLFFLNKIYGS